MPMEPHGAFRYSASIAEMLARPGDTGKTTTTTEIVMNAMKHMEAIFFAVAAAGVGTAFFTSDTPPLVVAADRPLFIHPDVHMPVVTIAARRPAPAEKS